MQLACNDGGERECEHGTRASAGGNCSAGSFFSHASVSRQQPLPSSSLGRSHTGSEYSLGVRRGRVLDSASRAASAPSLTSSRSHGWLQQWRSIIEQLANEPAICVAADAEPVAPPCEMAAPRTRRPRLCSSTARYCDEGGDAGGDEGGDEGSDEGREESKRDPAQPATRRLPPPVSFTRIGRWGSVRLYGEEGRGRARVGGMRILGSMCVCVSPWVGGLYSRRSFAAW